MKEIDLLKILKILLEHIIPILLSGIICAVIIFGYCSFFVTPTYKTVTTILVNNGGFAETGPSSNNTISGSDISASLYLVSTCVDVLESDNMFKDLATALDDKYSYYELMSRFSAKPRGEQSMLIDIYTVGTDPNEIKSIANTFLDIAPTFITNNIFNVDVKVLATADKTMRTGPRSLFNAGVGFIFGALVCAAIFVIIQLSKNTIESEKEFKNRYDIPLLGTVPFFENKTTGGTKRHGKSK